MKLQHPTNNIAFLEDVFDLTLLSLQLHTHGREGETGAEAREAILGGAEDEAAEEGERYEVTEGTG